MSTGNSNETQVIVDVLLATYNGEQFLVQQINSVLAQTYHDFRILIRDDGSTDNTVKILQQYQSKYPEKIKLIEDNLGNIGVTQNFNILMQQSSANYMCFCDQDDIWNPDKIEISLLEIQKIENNNSDIPCMVYSDMQIINEQNTLINASVWKSHKTKPSFFVLNRLLIYNIPFGCTMMFNKAFKMLVKSIPKEAILHDHWLALTAVTMAKYRAIAQPLMQLRNHEKSVTRASQSTIKKLQKNLVNLFTKKEHRFWLDIRIKQAKKLKEQYYSQLSKKDNAILNDFIALEHQNGLSRKINYVKNSFYKPDLVQTIRMILKA